MRVAGSRWPASEGCVDGGLAGLGGGSESILGEGEGGGDYISNGALLSFFICGSSTL